MNLSFIDKLCIQFSTVRLIKWRSIIIWRCSWKSKTPQLWMIVFSKWAPRLWILNAYSYAANCVKTKNKWSNRFHHLPTPVGTSDACSRTWKLREPQSFRKTPKEWNSWSVVAGPGQEILIRGRRFQQCWRIDIESAEIDSSETLLKPSDRKPKARILSFRAYKSESLSCFFCYSFSLN